MHKRLLIAALAVTASLPAAYKDNSAYPGDQPKAPKPTFTERRKAEKRKRKGK